MYKTLNVNLTLKLEWFAHCTTAVLRFFRYSVLWAVILIHNIRRCDVTSLWRLVCALAARYIRRINHISCAHLFRICKYFLQRDLWKVALCFFSDATEFGVAECPHHAAKVYKKRWHHQKHERVRLNHRFRHNIRHLFCAWEKRLSTAMSKQTCPHIITVVCTSAL